MSHVRKLVRDGIADLLDVNKVLYSSVYRSRVQSTRQVMPYVMIFSEGESDEVISVCDPTVYNRTISINVIGLLKMPTGSDTQTIEDKMDDMAVEIENKITGGALRALVPSVQTLRLTSTILEVVITTDDTISHAEVTIKMEVGCATTEGVSSSLI